MGPLALVLVLATQAAPPASQPFRWWLSPDVKAEIHLTDEQSRSINDIVESTLPRRRALREKLNALEAQLDRTLADATVSDEVATALIARVEQARARRNVERTMMLFRIRRLLTPAQRAWFDRRLKAAPPPR